MRHRELRSPGRPSDTGRRRRAGDVVDLQSPRDDHGRPHANGGGGRCRSQHRQGQDQCTAQHGHGECQRGSVRSPTPSTVEPRRAAHLAPPRRIQSLSGGIRCLLRSMAPSWISEPVPKLLFVDFNIGGRCGPAYWQNYPVGDGTVPVLGTSGGPLGGPSQTRRLALAVHLQLPQDALHVPAGRRQATPSSPRDLLGRLPTSMRIMMLRAAHDHRWRSVAAVPRSPTMVMWTAGDDGPPRVAWLQALLCGTGSGAAPGPARQTPVPRPGRTSVSAPGSAGVS